MMKLRVKAAHTAMVPNFEALDDGVMRFIGRRHDPTAGANGGWVPTDDVVEVPHRREYLDELKAGALLPADADTARAAGVPFGGT